MAKKAIKIDFNWQALGHKKIIDFLQNAIKNDTVHSAYLFVGPEGVGKDEIISYFACSLICQDKNSLPCQKCPSCQQFSKNIHADVFILERDQGKKNISIEKIRELQGKISLRSFFPSYKIAVIHEADQLTLEASNSLLKTLEEPQGKTVLILSSKSKDSLPETVVSRCQIINFFPLKNEEIYSHLVELGANRDEALKISRLSQGLPARALELFNNKELISAQDKFNDDFLEIMFQPDIDKRMFYVLNLTEDCTTQEILEILDGWTTILRDFVLAKNKIENYLVNLSSLNKIQKKSSLISHEKITNSIKNLTRTKKLISQNVNPRLALENFIINI